MDLQYPKPIYVPYVYERTSRGERYFDLFSRLLVDRIVLMGYAIDDVVSNIVIGQLLFLEAEDPDRDIHLYINSPGGDVVAGMAIYDTMQYIKPAVSTICIGMAASMGALLLAAGETGKRYALPHSRVLIHQPWGRFSGQASDIDIHAREILRQKQQLNEILAHHTGRELDQVEKDTDRDYIMSGEEAQGYGLVDRVIENHESLKSSDSED